MTTFLLCPHIAFLLVSLHVLVSCSYKDTSRTALGHIPMAYCNLSKALSPNTGTFWGTYDLGGGSHTIQAMALHKGLKFLVKFIRKYFIFSGAILNGILSPIISSNWWWYMRYMYVQYDIYICMVIDTPMLFLHPTSWVTSLVILVLSLIHYRVLQVKDHVTNEQIQF